MKEILKELVRINTIKDKDNKEINNDTLGHGYHDLFNRYNIY